ncbi:hypothetical protein V491_02496 [Pseudogymnoascus sp. VKM F-3775]|nr:hypothetical protein V491_02496 [Pseudogymnoascus sp. VKM F-3775]
MSYNEWIESEITKLVTEHGVVPPPYFEYPEIHPFSIGWRMGGGESYMMVFWTWASREKGGMNEAQRIAYCRQFPPPPLWLTWVINFIWRSEDDDRMDLDPEAGECSAYFKRTEELGLGTEEECRRAWKLEDEKMEAENESDEEKEEEEGKESAK